MKIFITCYLLISGLLGIAQSGNLKTGISAPDFNLKNVSGELVSFATFREAKGYILVFTCNTCPYARAYEQRIIELNAKYAPLGYPVIAINTNNPEVSPGDGFAEMVERAKANKYNFPYLADGDQKVTTAYGARNTPTVFLVRHAKEGYVIVYTGAIDNDPEEEKSKRINYVQEAISAIDQGKEPAVSSTKAIGCSVRKKKAA